MDVSILILNYKNKGLVLQCIKTLKMYAPKDGHTAQYEIIVVDNDSDDGLGEALSEKHPDVKFIASSENLGYAGGNNMGIKIASGRYVLIMNPDITTRPGAVDTLVKYMDRHPDVGIAGPKLVHPDGTMDDSCYRYPDYATPVYRRTPLGRLSKGKKAVERYTMADYDRKATRAVDWLLGAVLIVRKSALKDVGLLDDRFFLYFEDTDWCRRFWEAGHKVMYVTEATMVHYHERLSAQGSLLTSPFRKSTRIHITSCVKYFWKWKGKPVEARDTIHI